MFEDPVAERGSTSILYYHIEFTALVNHSAFQSRDLDAAYDGGERRLLLTKPQSGRTAYRACFFVEGNTIWSVPSLGIPVGRYRRNGSLTSTTRVFVLEVPPTCVRITSILKLCPIQTSQVKVFEIVHAVSSGLGIVSVTFLLRWPSGPLPF
jgi:hypothetical protein